MTEEQNEKLNELLRHNKILVDSHGTAWVDRAKLQETKDKFEKAFTEVFGEQS